jgi:hypothetical protein
MQSKSDMWENFLSKVIAREARKCAECHHRLSSDFRTTHVTRALKRSSELLVLISKGNLDYSSSLLICCNDLGEQSMV